jgi:tripartite-type tricarboxylate transporter receptor subunit TctC
MRAGIVVLIGLALCASDALGQSYPDRPIRLISPNPAGGANDTIVRIIAAKMSTILGASFVIDNRGGAGGKIGAEAAARAAPDGYTLLAASVSTHSFAPVVTPKLGYDPIKDFEPISLLALVQNVLVVNPSLPVANVSELIALARSEPGKLNYASGGPGSTSHFAVAMFVALAGIQHDTVHVPYKGGAAAMTATIANEAQFYFGPTGAGNRAREQRTERICGLHPRTARAAQEARRGRRPQARPIDQALGSYGHSTGWVTTHGKKARGQEAQQQRAALQRYSL